MIAAEPDTAVKMFKQVLRKLVDTKCKTTEQAVGILTQYKKFLSWDEAISPWKLADFNFYEDQISKKIAWKHYASFVTQFQKIAMETIDTRCI